MSYMNRLWSMVESVVNLSRAHGAAWLCYHLFPLDDLGD